MLNTMSDLKHLRKVRCVFERRSMPDQIKAGNTYYVDTATLSVIDGDCYADYYDENYTFVGFLNMDHFTAVVEY